MFSHAVFDCYQANPVPFSFLPECLAIELHVDPVTVGRTVVVGWMSPRSGLGLGGADRWGLSPWLGWLQVQNWGSPSPKLTKGWRFWLLSDWWKNYQAMDVGLLPMLRASLIRKEPSRSKKRSYETPKIQMPTSPSYTGGTESDELGVFPFGVHS